MSNLAERHGSAENTVVGDVVYWILNYFAESAEKPVIYTYEPPSGFTTERRREISQTSVSDWLSQLRIQLIYE
jgi:hypothetical protein